MDVYDKNEFIRLADIVVAGKNDYNHWHVREAMDRGICYNAFHDHSYYNKNISLLASCVQDSTSFYDSSWLEF